MSDENILDPTAVLDDRAVEAALRPKHLAEFVGQTRVREQLDLVLQAAQGARPCARSRAAIGSARARQDNTRHDYRCRTRSAHSHHVRAGDPACGRPRGGVVLARRR